MNSTNTTPGAKADALVGSVVNGKYKILSLVAAGGMGKVYQAEQLPLGRSVALKVLQSKVDSGIDEARFEKRFLREASILSRLQHPNIVTVFDFGAIEGGGSERFYIAMEFLDGRTLAQRIETRGRLSVNDTIRIARQISRGLREAHAHGVIHRDLKPSNVMLIESRDGKDVAKIVDFGIVKIVGEDSQESQELTEEGSVVGSPKYMAPEQIDHNGKVDARTDIYSFGVILYQCITGTVPFAGETAIQTLMGHVNDPAPPIHARCPEAHTPEWLEQFVMSCLEKDPNKRPQSVDLIAKMLAEAEAGLSSRPSLAPSSSQPRLFDDSAETRASVSVVAPKKKGSRTLLLGAGIVAVAVVGVLVTRSVSVTKEPAPSSAQTGVSRDAAVPVLAPPVTPPPTTASSAPLAGSETPPASAPDIASAPPSRPSRPAPSSAPAPGTRPDLDIRMNR